MRHAAGADSARGELRDPALREANITVTEVRVSPDLRNATAFVMPLGGAKADEIIAALKRSAPFLRGWRRADLQLRHVPEPDFALDETFDQAERISAVLARPEVARDLHPQPAEGETDDDAA